ncbi:MAG: MFS transporter [Dermatophilaceae bacterium]
MTTPHTPPLTPEAARRIFYLLMVTRWFPVGLVVGILILLLTGRGLTIAQAATAAAVTGVVTFVLELPTSGIADALGRRPVYLAAAVVGVAAGFAYAVAQSFWAFVVAGVLTGAFRALDSGPLESWLVDTIHESEPDADVDQPLARAGTVLGVSIALGAVVSGAVIWWHPVTSVLGYPLSPIDGAVWIFAVLNVVHLIAAWALIRETPRGAHATRRAAALASAREAPAVIGSGLRLLRHSPVLLGLVLAETFWSIGMVTFESLMPLRLEELVGSAQRAGALMGPAAAAAWGLFAGGAALSGLASARLGVARAAVLGRTLNALGAVIMGLVAGPVALVIAYLFTYSTHGMNGPPHAALLHRVATSANRTVVLSMNSMMAFLAFAVAAPLLGALADGVSIQHAMVLAGAISILGAFCYLPARRAERAG